jgi:hypothetical protein
MAARTNPRACLRRGFTESADGGKRIEEQV